MHSRLQFIERGHQPIEVFILVPRMTISQSRLNSAAP